MACLESFNPFTDADFIWPFSQLTPIVREAAGYLGKYTAAELCEYARNLRADMDRMARDETELRKIALVDRLLKDGGWEMKYYADDAPVTAEGIQVLLESWPEDADEECPLPSEEDFDDAELLTLLLESCWFINPKYSDPGWDAEVERPDELWALLCVMKVEEALETLGRIGERRTKFEELSSYSVAAAGDLALEAARAIAAAKDAEQWLLRQWTQQQATRADEQISGGSKRRLPPSASGGAGKGAAFSEVEAFVKAGVREKLRSGSFDRDAFIISMMQEIPARFAKRANSKLGKSGEPRKVRLSTLERWIREATLLFDPSAK
jgi:hypothetical protein